VTEAEWLDGDEPMRMIDFLAWRTSKRKLRLFACACCRRIWDLLTDEASRDAVEIAERHADGRATDWELNAAWRSIEQMGLLGASEAAQLACQFEAQTAAEAAVAWAAVPCYGTNRDDLAENRILAGLARCVFGNPFRRLPTLDPLWLSWQDGTIANLAQALYEERELPQGTLDATRLSILADALEEAGCADEAILDHLRQPGLHVRGCWVVDLVTGRE
jgi:hypothetical protein